MALRLCLKFKYAPMIKQGRDKYLAAKYRLNYSIFKTLKHMYVRALIRINSTEIDNKCWRHIHSSIGTTIFFSPGEKVRLSCFFLIQLEVQVKNPIHIRHPLIGKDDTHKHTSILMIAHSRL